jgi:hypothetical protein
MKSLWTTIKETLQGTNSEGSAKRATAFYFTAILLTSLTAVYEYGFYKAVNAIKPTEVHILVIKMYDGIHFSLQLSIWGFFGLATIETITTLVKVIKGVPDKKEDAQA